MMKKALALFKTCLQNFWQYRVEGMIWTLTDLMVPIAMLFFWNTVYKTQLLVAGTTKVEMLGYYLASAFISIVLITHPEYDVAYHINQGVLQNYLIKPQSFLHYVLVNEFSYKFNRMIVGVPGMLLMYLVVTQLFHVEVSFVFSIAQIILLIGAFFLAFMFKVLIGMMAFWTTDVEWIIGIDDLLSYFLSGTLLPLTLFPEQIKNILSSLPFAFYSFVPIQALLGKYSSDEMLTILGGLFFWLLVIFSITYFVWKKGLKNYAAYGG